MSTTQVLYELQGESLAAAKKLDAYMRKAWERKGFEWQGKNMADIQRLAHRFQDDVFAELQDKHPDLLEQTGLNLPAIQVKNFEDGYPRAYKSYPQVFTSGTKPERYFMYAPVDYRDENFEPADAREITDPKEEQAIGDLLFAGGWLGNAPILDRRDEGVATPGDYDPETSNSWHAHDLHDGQMTKKVFIAAGRSLSVVEDYLRFQKTYDDAVSALMEEVSRIGENELDAPEDEEPYVNQSLGQDQNGKRELRVSLRSRRRGGEQLPLSNNKYFLIESMRHGEAKIVPNPDTEEGRAFKKLYDAVPSRPSLGRYWQLWNPTAPKIKDEFNVAGESAYRAPRLDTVGGIHYLVYTVERGKFPDNCNPPDSIPVNPAEYIWRHEDIADRNRGIKPPPPPKELAYMQPLRQEAPSQEPAETSEPAEAQNDRAGCFVCRLMARISPP